MELNELKDNEGARRSKTRLGRGIGSGKGKTAARGHKGQKSRSGVAIKGFEGGQMPIYRRLPKRGFNNSKFATNYAVVNLSDLAKAIETKRLDAKKTVNKESLVTAGLVRKSDELIKLLGNGELKEKLTIEVNKASKSATAKIEKAGGKLTIVEAKPAPAEKKEAKAKKADA